MSDQIRCPKCGSSQIHADKKGYSVGKAAAGVVLTGGIGLAAGVIGANKIKITCLKCGYKFNPGEGKYTKSRKASNTGCAGVILLLIFVIIIFII